MASASSIPFKIESIRMRDGISKKVFFEVKGWENILNIKEMRIDKELLNCSAVETEYGFSSENEYEELRMEQMMLLKGKPIELFKFEFGFIIPGSMNTLDSTIHSAGKGNMLPVQVLSGNLECLICFYEGEKLLAEKRVRVFYI